jgi:hypothetical protein
MLRLLLALFLLIPMPVLADHVPTQAPYGTDASDDANEGTFTIGILGSDGFEDSPPENYTIFFSLSSGVTETNSFCVTTSFGHQANTWQYYTFSLDDLKYYFNDPAGNNIYYRVRSNNETDNSVSTLTNENTWNLYAGLPFDYTQTDWSAPTGTDACNPYVVTTTTTTTTVPPAVPDDATNVSVNYQGKDVYFAWEYTDGNTLVNEFHINYSYDNSIWDRVIITNTTARTYTLDYTNIQTGTFYWTFSVCGDIENGESCTDSDSNNFETYEYVAPTTTLAPVVEEVYVEPEPLPPPPEEIIVDVKVEGVDKTYTQADVNDGTIERDQERIDNENKFGCFMTNAQIERGDCDIPEPIEEDIKDDIIKEDVVIKEDIVEDKKDVELIIPKDDVVVLDPPKEEVIKDEVVEFEEPPIEFEIIEFDMEDIAPEIVVEIPIQDEIEKEIKDEKIEEDVQEVLDEPIQEVVSEDTPGTTLPRVEDKEPLELTEEEVAVEVAQIEEVIDIEIEIATEEEIDNFTEEELVEYEEAKKEAIQEYVQDLTEEEVVEVLEEVNDIGVQNLDQATEEVQEIVQAVVKEAIADVEELTEKQVEVVAEVFQVEAEDVSIIAESVKDDEVIAEAVEEYVERAVDNSDVENYTLADVVTEVSYESFIENPIETFVDFDDLGDITIANIGDDMTQDQREKAQEVVVPVILTRIASMAAFVFRRNL